MDEYDKQERISIKLDSHIPEHLAIKQTEKEYSVPEAILKLQQFKQKKLEIEAAKRAKHSKRFNYE